VHERVVGFNNLTIDIPDEDPNDVGFDQPDLCLRVPAKGSALEVDER
jgi:hypothetical protein